MCLSSRVSDFNDMLHAQIPCDVIYSKEFGNGTLYALVLAKKTAHVTLDHKIVDLDRMLMRAGGDTTTRFTSLSDVLEGKVKTFGAREHVSDEHFNAIFSSGNPGGRRALSVHPEVRRGDPPVVVASIDGEVADDTRLTEAQRMQVLVDKHVTKLKSRISVYRRVLSASGQNVARLRLDADKFSDEMSVKVPSEFFLFFGVKYLSNYFV
jgi:hypothetical protein